MSYKFTKLSNLNHAQLNELIRLHKVSIPDSPFSVQRNDLCKKIYKSISSNKKFFNIVIISNDQPLGLFVGRVGVVRITNFMSSYDYFIWFWRIFSQQKLDLFWNVLDYFFLALTKTVIRNKYWIELMYIDKSLQSKGVGTKLLNIYINSVPKGNKIWVDTKKENKPAIDFYEKNNFTKKHSLLLKNLMLVRKKI